MKKSLIEDFISCVLLVAIGRVQVEMPSLVAIDIVIVKICYLLVT